MDTFIWLDDHPAKVINTVQPVSVVAAGFSASMDFTSPKAGKLMPYSAVFFASTGILLSSFIWNSIVMKKPFVGEPVSFIDYFTRRVIQTEKDEEKIRKLRAGGLSLVSMIAL